MLGLQWQLDPMMHRLLPHRARRCWKHRIAEPAYGDAYQRRMSICVPVEAGPAHWTEVGPEFSALGGIANVDIALPEDPEAIALVVSADTEH